MSNEFSLAHLTVLDSTPPEMTYLAAKAGYDYVGFRVINMGLPGEPNYDLASNRQMLRETKQALTETGIKVLDIELAKIFDGVDPKNYEPAMEVAAELGGRHILSSIWSDDKSYATEKFAELCDLAKHYDLTVELEYVPIASVINLKESIEILETVNKENAGLMIDTHHFDRAQDNITDLQRVPKEWFRYMHICDAIGQIPSSREEMLRIIREERLYLGEGGIDVASIIKNIPKIPYSLELPNIKLSRELGNEEFARQCLQFAKSYFEQHDL
ncbi:sugar phosphate isomerase/epimerase family protein [Oceanobacillus sp. CAU 1775]